MQILSKKDKKCVKVICTYFGDRRSVHNTPKNTIDFLKIMIENEISIENGLPTDVIIVNNDVNNFESNQILMSYNNTKTNNGSIFIEFRKNKGGSFGAYYETFLKYKDNYDYWFFCEDDVLIFKEKYIEDFVNFLDSNENIGFVALAPISSSKYPKHSGGGCGLTSKEKFLNSRSIEYIQNFINSKSNINETYSDFEKYEIDFTNKFIRSGMDIENHPNYSPYCINFENHLGQKNNYTTKNSQLEFIYKVGF